MSEFNRNISYWEENIEWLSLAYADVLKDRKITSYASIKKDMIIAGAKWEDSEVVVD